MTDQKKIELVKKNDPSAPKKQVTEQEWQQQKQQLQAQGWQRADGQQ